MNWLSIAVIVFLVIMAGYGASKGLIRMIMSFASVLIAILIVSIVSEPLEQIVKERTIIYEFIESGVNNYVSEGVTAVAENIAEGTEALLETLSLPNLLEESLLRDDTPENYQSLGVSDSFGYVSTWLTDLVFSGLVFVAGFIAVRIILWLITLILCAIMRLPLLKQVNSLTGALLSVAMGLVLLWIGCLIVTASAASPWGTEILSLIEESQILSFIYNNNYLMSDILIR